MIEGVSARARRAPATAAARSLTLEGRVFFFVCFAFRARPMRPGGGGCDPPRHRPMANWPIGQRAGVCARVTPPGRGGLGPSPPLLLADQAPQQPPSAGAGKRGGPSFPHGPHAARPLPARVAHPDPGEGVRLGTMPGRGGAVPAGRPPIGRATPSPPLPRSPHPQPAPRKHSHTPSHSLHSPPGAPTGTNVALFCHVPVMATALAPVSEEWGTARPGAAGREGAATKAITDKSEASASLALKKPLAWQAHTDRVQCGAGEERGDWVGPLVG